MKEDQEELPLDLGTRQAIKDLEDQIIDFHLILDNTYDTTIALIQKYEQYCLIATTSSITLDESVDSIRLSLEDKKRDIELARRTIDALQKKLKSTISLVSRLLKRTFFASPVINSSLRLSCLLDLRHRTFLQGTRRKGSGKEHHDEKEKP